MAVLAPVDMLQSGDDDVPIYTHLLEGVIPPKPVENISDIVASSLGVETSTVCQIRVIKLIWELAGRVIHMLR